MEPSINLHLYTMKFRKRIDSLAMPSESNNSVQVPRPEALYILILLGNVLQRANDETPKIIAAFCTPSLHKPLCNSARTCKVRC